MALIGVSGDPLVLPTPPGMSHWAGQRLRAISPFDWPTADLMRVTAHSELDTATQTIVMLLYCDWDNNDFQDTDFTPLGGTDAEWRIRIFCDDGLFENGCRFNSRRIYSGTWMACDGVEGDSDPFLRKWMFLFSIDHGTSTNPELYQVALGDTATAPLSRSYGTQTQGSGTPTTASYDIGNEIIDDKKFPGFIAWTGVYDTGFSGQEARNFSKTMRPPTGTKELFSIFPGMGGASALDVSGGLPHSAVGISGLQQIYAPPSLWPPIVFSGDVALATVPLGDEVKADSDTATLAEGISLSQFEPVFFAEDVIRVAV